MSQPFEFPVEKEVCENGRCFNHPVTCFPTYCVVFPPGTDKKIQSPHGPSSKIYKLLLARLQLRPQ